MIEYGKRAQKAIYEVNLNWFVGAYQDFVNGFFIEYYAS